MICHPGIMPAAVFRFENVEVGDPPRLRIDGLDIHEGITAVIGPSGSGKTTLLRLCNRLLSPDKGRILYRGEPVDSLDPHQLRREVGMVFQDPVHLEPTVTADLRVADPAATDTDLARALESVGLPPGFGGRSTAELSGGESQRVCLARALLVGPQVVLVDEPTSSLDTAAALQLERLISGVAADGVSVLWVTHDLSQARRVAHRAIRVEHGQVMDAGDLEALSRHPT